MIRFGPSGIPLSCKGRTLKDGIKDVHALGLTAIEVQLLRMNTIERYVSEDEVGLTPLQLPNGLTVEILRGEPKGKVIYDLNTQLKQGDILHVLASGIAKNYERIIELEEIAKDLDITISLHAPYYMDLAGNPEAVKRSMNNIMWSGLIANQLDANVVVTHLGLYGSLSKKKCMERMLKNVRYLRDWYKEMGIKAKLGLETSGRKAVFGSLNDILTICKKVRGTIPVLNFAHVHARGDGSLRKKEDFQKIFDSAKKFMGDGYYIHFSGVEYENGNEKRYTPIKKGDLKFDPLAESILDHNFNITIISSSPLLEHDAMYMKLILERVFMRRRAKRMKKGKNLGEEKK